MRASAARRLTVLQLPPIQSVTKVYHLASVDMWGRLVVGAAMETLAWRPRTRLAMQPQGGLLRVTADPDGTVTVTKRGQLRVPLALRRWCTLEAGTQVLVVADPLAAHLIIHPLAAVEQMVARQHAETFGGDA